MKNSDGQIEVPLSTTTIFTTPESAQTYFDQLNLKPRVDTDSTPESTE